MHIISGESISNIVRKSYSKDAPIEIKPSKFDLEKLKLNYDNLFPEFNTIVNKHEINYRTYLA